MAVLWISVIVVLLDQATKLMIKGSPWTWLPFEGIPYGHSMPFIDDIVRITYIENPGIAFGINIPGMKVFFAVFSIVASLAILIYLQRNLHKLRMGERIALALVLGGAVGNLIDRVFYGVMFHEQPLFYGRVVDFIDFGVHRNMFPVFNVADSCVTIGVSMLVLLMMRQKKTEPVPTGNEPSVVQSEETHIEGSSNEINESPSL